MIFVEVLETLMTNMSGVDQKHVSSFFASVNFSQKSYDDIFEFCTKCILA